MLLKKIKLWYFKDGEGGEGDGGDPASSDGGLESFIESALGDGAGAGEGDDDASESDESDDNQDDDANDDDDAGADDDSSNDDDSDDSDGDSTGDDDSSDDNSDDDATDDADDASSGLQKKIDEQAGQIEKLMGLLEKTINKPKPEPEPEPEPDIYEDDTFKALVKVLDLDEGDDKVLAAFFEKFSAQTQRRSVDDVLKATPEMVNKVVDNKTKTQQVKEKFYTDNAELAAVKPYVSTIAGQIAKDNPTLTVQEVLAKTAETAYKALGITKKDVKDKGSEDASDESGKEKKQKKKPAFAKTKGARKGKATKSKLASQIDSMLALDE